MNDIYLFTINNQAFRKISGCLTLVNVRDGSQNSLLDLPLDFIHKIRITLWARLATLNNSRINSIKPA